MQILLAWQGLLSTHLLLTAEICHYWTWTAVTPCPSSGGLGRCQESSELVLHHAAMARLVLSLWLAHTLQHFGSVFLFENIKKAIQQDTIQNYFWCFCSSSFRSTPMLEYLLESRNSSLLCCNHKKWRKWTQIKSLPAPQEQYSWQKTQIISRNDRLTNCLLSFPSYIHFSFSVWWLVLHWWSF